MITVKEAIGILQKNTINLNKKIIQIEKATGYILNEDIYSFREQPPFNRVAMDGISIKFSQLKESSSFNVVGVQKAGSEQLSLENINNCFEVMTGAILPNGTDTVIPYEVINIENDCANILDPKKIKEKQNIHFKGSDYLKGELLLKSGVRINSQVIALIASVGKKEIQVLEVPKIAVISTGDELIEPGMETLPWQIYRSNPYCIKSELVNRSGLQEKDIDLYKLPDNPSVISDKLSVIIKKYKIVILSGGVSKGKFDFIPSVLSSLGVTKQFHKIKQRPGKPMYFGIGKEGQNIFGLPGNPVSAVICLRRYIIESINYSINKKNSDTFITLSEDIHFKKALTLFKPVSINFSNLSNLKATPITGNGSGDFSSLVNTNGFIELPENKTVFKAGESFKYFSWN